MKNKKAWLIMVSSGPALMVAWTYLWYIIFTGGQSSYLFCLLLMLIVAISFVQVIKAVSFITRDLLRRKQERRVTGIAVHE